MDSFTLVLEEAVVISYDETKNYGFCRRLKDNIRIFFNAGGARTPRLSVSSLAEFRVCFSRQQIEYIPKRGELIGFYILRTVSQGLRLDEWTPMSYGDQLLKRSRELRTRESFWSRPNMIAIPKGSTKNHGVNSISSWDFFPFREGDEVFGVQIDLSTFLGSNESRCPTLIYVFGETIFNGWTTNPNDRVLGGDYQATDRIYGLVPPSTADGWFWWDEASGQWLQPAEVVFYKDNQPSIGLAVNNQLIFRPTVAERTRPYIVRSYRPGKEGKLPVLSDW